jgi:hypothetical protein
MQALPQELPTTRAHGPLVEIVVPVHNEQQVLEASVERLHEYLVSSFPFAFRITIADNASSDGTWLVAPLLSGHSDLAIGTRLANGAAVVRGPKRELVSRCYNLLLRTAMRARFTDAQCGFKAGRTEVVQALLPVVEDQAWFFDTELLLAAQRSGLRIHEVPVDWVEDTDSRVDVLQTALDDLRGMARVARRQLPGPAGDRGGQHRGQPPLHLRGDRPPPPAAPAPGGAGAANAAATVARFVLLRSWVFHPHRTSPKETPSR